MSHQLLFERSTGIIGPNTLARLQTTQLLRSFRAAPRFRFDGGERLAAAANATGSETGNNGRADLWAHQAGVNALAVERFDGRILISGGSDATIRLWDLEQAANPTVPHTFRPIAQVARGGDDAPSGHRYGITHLSFYPFDSAAFLSSSYDQTLKLWATERARPSGSFNLGAKVYTHALSPVASHLLVACATQHPAVRLVDLRSAAAVQSLVCAGQRANLAVAWSPVHEHVLASGSVDGAVRIWDVRRASGLLGLLDQEDGLGMLYNGRGGTHADITGAGNSARQQQYQPQQRAVRASARAHTGAVNGLTWTDDGAYIVSAGHDRKIRVWDAATGANTLVNFGPNVRNGGPPTSLTMFASPVGLTTPRRELLFYPNETEILIADLHEGTTVARLRGMGASIAAVRTHGATAGVTERTVRNRLTSIAWRGGGGGGSVMGGTNAAGGIFSGHLDGQIRAWLPLLIEGRDDEDDLGVGPAPLRRHGGEREGEGEEEERARKKRALDSAYRSLMGGRSHLRSVILSQLA